MLQPAAAVDPHVFPKGLHGVTVPDSHSRAVASWNTLKSNEVARSVLASFIAATRLLPTDASAQPTYGEPREAQPHQYLFVVFQHWLQNQKGPRGTLPIEAENGKPGVNGFWSWTWIFMVIFEE